MRRTERKIRKQKVFSYKRYKNIEEKIENVKKFDYNQEFISEIEIETL